MDNKETVCALCHEEENGKQTLYIGNDQWRHTECDPIKYGALSLQDRQLADTLWVELLSCADTIQDNRLKLLGILSTFNQEKLYRCKGFSTWGDFCNYLGMKKSWSYELLKIANNPYLIEKIKADPKLIEERPKHLTVIADMVTRDNVDELVDKASKMTVTNLRNDVMPHADGGEFVTKSYRFRRSDLATLEDAIEHVRGATGEANSGTCIIHLAENYLAEVLAQ